jgi:endoglucanase
MKIKKPKKHGMALYGVLLVVLVGLGGYGVFQLDNLPHDSSKQQAARTLPALTRSVSSLSLSGTRNLATTSNASVLPGAGQTVNATVTAPALGQGTLYANNASYLQQSQQWLSLHPSELGPLQQVLAQPIARWFGDWNTDVQADVNSYVTAAQKDHAIPILVAYNIPDRDCNGYSSGGAEDATDYARWMDSFVSGIGKRQAIVIVEPDALTASCFTNDRATMLAKAVKSLASNTSASVYIDAGNPAWQSVAVMAKRLQQADVAQATGFSLNVASFYATSANIRYGLSLSNQLGGKHFVIDTSRNGTEASGASGVSQLCNPADAALGQTPTLVPGQSAVDAYLWIKVPGESDGSGAQCTTKGLASVAPPAGTWWPDYAVMLAHNASR